MSIYIYVDGESHYHRSADYWARLHAGASLDTVMHGNRFATIPAMRTARDNQFAHDKRGRLFWDSNILYVLPVAPRLLVDQVISRSMYFTSFTGPISDFHEFQLKVRDAGLDPIVLPEHKDLKDQRDHRRDDTGKVYKAKGVDISLAVHLLEDATYNNFSHCYLFTSDVDFLPAIEAVRRKGKRVYVVGFPSGLGERSPLLHVPDAFIDLGPIMENRYALKEAQTGGAS